METDPKSEHMTAGTDEQQHVTRHRDGEHVAGRPETVDESEIRAGQREPGLESIDALPDWSKSLSVPPSGVHATTSRVGRVVSGRGHFNGTRREYSDLIVS